MPTPAPERQPLVLPVAHWNGADVRLISTQDRFTLQGKVGVGLSPSDQPTQPLSLPE